MEITPEVASVSITINRDEVCRRLGFGKRSPSPSMAALIDSQIARAYELIKPTYTYVVRAIQNADEQELTLEGGLVFRSRTVAYALAGCQWAAMYLATIGRALPEESSRLMSSGETPQAYVLDNVGNEAVAETVRVIREVIKTLAEKHGRQATVQYSPGYCDWNVSQQRVLFQGLNPVPLGVTLTESNIMQPLKSTTGVFGIGTLDKSRRPPCLAVCHDRSTCRHKRVGWNPEERAWL